VYINCSLRPHRLLSLEDHIKSKQTFHTKRDKNEGEVELVLYHRRNVEFKRDGRDVNLSLTGSPGKIHGNPIVIHSLYGIRKSFVEGEAHNSCVWWNTPYNALSVVFRPSQNKEIQKKKAVERISSKCTSKSSKTNYTYYTVYYTHPHRETELQLLWFLYVISAVKWSFEPKSSFYSSYLQTKTKQTNGKQT